VKSLTTTVKRVAVLGYREITPAATIADEVDSQLKQAMLSYTNSGLVEGLG
jgi:hypothetical protein